MRIIFLLPLYQGGDMLPVKCWHHYLFFTMVSKNVYPAAEVLNISVRSVCEPPGLGPPPTT